MGGRGGRALAVLCWPEARAGGCAPPGAPVLPWEAWGEAWALCCGLCWQPDPGHAAPRLPGGTGAFLLQEGARSQAAATGWWRGRFPFSGHFLARCFSVTPPRSLASACGSFLDNSRGKSTNEEGGTGRRTTAIQGSGARCRLRTESSKRGCEAQIRWTASPGPLGAVSCHRAGTIGLSHSLGSSAWCWGPARATLPPDGRASSPTRCVQPPDDGRAGPWSAQSLHVYS